MKTIFDLQNEVHNTAVTKGFWETEHKLLNHPDLDDEDKKNIKLAFQSQRLMLVVSELAEGMEVLRKKDYEPTSDEIKKLLDEATDEEFPELFVKYVKDQYSDELSDASIRIMDISGGDDVDLEWHIKAKMRYNATRPYKHGKNF